MGEGATELLAKGDDRLVATLSNDEVRKTDVLRPIDPEILRRMAEPIVRSLSSRLGRGVDEAVIAVEVEAELATYATARVIQFVPILVESRVWARLRQTPPGGNA